MNESGILVCGDNHLILGGPLPGPECARRLAHQFGLRLVTLGPPPVRQWAQWEIRTREFRERLTWAVQLMPYQNPSPAVATLLAELSQRGLTIHREPHSWEGTPCD